VKKCASCSKDLPEAALHCVFCGAKQAPAPAVAPSSVAKTAFGYSANEVMQQLGNPPQPARPNPGSQPPPVGGPPSGQVPHAAANAKTMFASAPAQPYAQPAPQPYGAPAQPYAQPAPQPYGAPAQPFGAPAQPYAQPAPQPYAPPAGGFGAPSPAYPSAPAPQAYAPPGAAGGMGIHSPQQATPAPLPSVPQPYLNAQTGVRRRPVEPFKQSLKLMMFVWGAIALAAFATPVSTGPVTFQWDAIIHGAGSAKIPALVWAGVGLLAIVFAAIPMSTLPRGVLAAVLGLAGIFVPMLVGSFPEWQKLLPLLGALALVPGLLVRHEYTESLLSRILVTVGVVFTLLPFLIPEGGQIPLVVIIKALIDAGSHMEIVIIALAQIVLVVLCLLAWMPGPATAGAKVFAWAVLLFPVASFLLVLLGQGHLGDMISKAPGMMVMWAPAVAYSVFVGYGLATVIGKQLE
jgi:hypothetical protein